MSKAVVIPGSKDIGGMREELSISPSEKKDGAIGLLRRFLRFESLKRSSPVSPTSLEPSVTYYGVYIPCEIKKGPDEEALHVYENKADALELVKRYKLARFKAFRNRQDAISFALRGAEPVDTTDGNDNSLMGEKPYPFKAPSPQDMVSLRKAIEAGLTCTVRDRVWDNPRFLVSSGNTPAIMQEGSRYNALHVAAKSMNAEICNLILTTVGDPAFVQKLYGGDADPESCKEFAGILVDRYLNTPDKAMNETPLHFAAKFGAEEVVDVLTSFPQCDLSAVNKYGEQAKDIICKRASGRVEERAGRMATLLQQRYYVPVLHCEDGSAAPEVGRPFTPAAPPDINPDPLSPRYEIRAYAGPMRAERAASLRVRWKTPPRAAFRLHDLAKGLETVGRNLANEMNVDWKEYWPFLETFTDLRTTEGLTLLENYLKAKYESAWSLAYSDSCVESRLEDSSVSRIALSLSHNSPVVETNLSPMSELCDAMRTCKISNDRPSHWNRTDPVKQRLCRQPHKLAANGDSSPIANHTVSRLLCIERTCQVFAKRIADALALSLSLRSEAKHLQHTISTYMDDERFQKIDFALIHSRLAQLVVSKLKQRTDDVSTLLEYLVKLRCPNEDIFSSDEERRPGHRARHKLSQVIDEHVRCLSSFVCEELNEAKGCKGPAVSESECLVLWEHACKCLCDWKVELDRSSKRNSSFRKNRSTLSTSPKSDSFIRRLNFDHDIGDGKLQNVEFEKPVLLNSPAGDGGPTLVTVQMDKCQVVEAELSEDESIASCNSEGEEAYVTASEHSEAEEEMFEALDRAAAEPFIYGEEPSKADRLVYDALADCRVSPDEYPCVYRWRHAVGLYAPRDRNSWREHEQRAESRTFAAPAHCSTPRGGPGGGAWGTQGGGAWGTHGGGAWGTHGGGAWSTQGGGAGGTPGASSPDRTISLQVSRWLRVTGPNSPRSAPAVRSAGHNVSFGF
ncbi:ankyrin repeat and LEM domain-containing protein 2 homolog isoform X1 [Bombyx mori]|uniref:ANKLE2 third alpha/beta domain-containing protein n=2 Tax=Bombyx mori TaxID=7091 RepID=A0A8R1WGV2_BOMMO|nr:ankyrin repeat and LEM domain-containing protein 2 isoform X2 [Bombyx mori]